MRPAEKISYLVLVYRDGNDASVTSCSALGRRKWHVLILYGYIGKPKMCHAAPMLCTHIKLYIYYVAP